MIKTTASTGRRRVHGSASKSRRSVTDQQVSERTTTDDRPDVDELRQVRAGFYNRSPENRERESRRDMEIHARPRGSSRTKASIRLSDVVTIREERRRHESERRHHRKRPKEEASGDEAYVYRSLENNHGGKAPERRHHRRRSAISIIPYKEEPGRVRVSVGGLSRRTTDKKTSQLRQEASVASRTEHRSNSNSATNNVPRYPPVARYYDPCEVMRKSSMAHADSTYVRSASMRVPNSERLARPLIRSQTTTRKARRSSRSLSRPIVEEVLERNPSNSKRNERPASILGTIFGIPRLPEPMAEKQVECLTCLSSDIPISKSAKLSCNHRMCHSCLRRIFTLSVTDPQHMPPKCCTQDHIPLKHVDKLFDVRFKMKWNQKYQEYTTKNRIYCPAKGCGEWIKPAYIRTDPHSNRKYGKCHRCRTKVCTTCNGKWHSSRDCPKDEATQRFAEIAKEKGWQRCYNCSATVELKEGCNHMTCRCRAEFCMICGLKWKTCTCPWFNYETVERDRLNHMNIAQPPGPGVANPALNYQEEMDRRMEQERQDEALARRMQGIAITFDRPNYYHQPHPAFLPPQPGYQNFIQRTADVLSAPYNPAYGGNVGAPAPEPIHVHTQRPFLASRMFVNRPGMRGEEMVVPRRVVHDYESEASRHRPSTPGDDNEDLAQMNSVRRVGAAGSSHSILAGLSMRTVEGRVDQWRRHVGDD